MSLLVTAISVLSILTALIEAWTILYLCTESARRLGNISLLSDILVSSNFVKDNDVNRVLYSFCIMFVALPRMMLLYLPKLRPLLLHASILHICSAGLHFYLSSRIWLGSLGDQFYRFVILSLGGLFFLHFSMLTLEASRDSIVQQEKRAADIQKIRISRKEYEECRRRSAALREASVLKLS